MEPVKTGDPETAFSNFRINVSKDYYEGKDSFDPNFQPTIYASGKINYT